MPAAPESGATPAWRVALPLPLPQLFDYAPPTGHAASADDVGHRVRVPLGNRELTGIVVEVGPPAGQGAELRPALARLDPAPVLSGELLASLRWLARYTHAPLGEVLATALPAALRRGEPWPDTRTWSWQLTEAGHTALPGMRAGRPRRLAELLADGPREEAWLADSIAGWRAAVRSLDKRGLVERIALPASVPPSELSVGAASAATAVARIQHDGEKPAEQAAPARPTPNAEQQTAIDAILAARGGFAALLLDGVTGSGKTEVYLHAIADCLARGRQALVLVPEIGLTPQMLARFRARLGVPVQALHSGLNDNERARVWAAAGSGQARVVVGTRSAVFVPLPDAGLVVVDEEHDASYKQYDGIRYHARDFALVRGKALDVPVLLGSATPSLESLHNARAGRYAHLRLTRRAGDARPPEVRVLDVRKRPLDAGLSPEMLQAISTALDAGGQVLVFKNRRGYAPALLCHDCGWSAQCTRCDSASQGVAMTVHGGGRRLQCHHCGSRRGVPQACPDCGGLALQAQGVGTERLEEVLVDKFAEYPVLRVDRGSTRRRDALAAMLDKLGDAPGVLVGTQMLAKGHDLAHLTLVAVVGIDEGLFSADFRAREKLAQLLIQVAGRAGRADKPGQVLLQTHHPDHPLLQTLVHGGYHAFAEAELEQREAAGFPPFAHLALLRAEAKTIEATRAFLQAARGLFAALIAPDADSARIRSANPASAPHPALRATPDQKRHGGRLFSRREKELQVHGPLPAPMPRRAGYQRMQLLLSADERRALHATLDAVVPALYALPEARKVRWSLDVDPVDLY